MAQSSVIGAKAKNGNGHPPQKEGVIRFGLMAVRGLRLRLERRDVLRRDLRPQRLRLARHIRFSRIAAGTRRARRERDGAIDVVVEPETVLRLPRIRRPTVERYALKDLRPALLVSSREARVGAGKERGHGLADVGFGGANRVLHLQKAGVVPPGGRDRVLERQRGAPCSLSRRAW